MTVAEKPDVIAEGICRWLQRQRAGALRGPRRGIRRAFFGYLGQPRTRGREVTTKAA